MYFASSDVDLIARIKKEVSIWNINSFVEFYLQIYGKYENDYAKACQKFIAEREIFFRELTQISYLHVIPSQANYFLCEVINKYTSAELTQKVDRSMMSSSVTVIKIKYGWTEFDSVWPYEVGRIILNLFVY